MADWNDIKKAFEKDKKSEEDLLMEKEQKLHKDVTMYVCNLKGVSPLHGYHPNDLIDFLEKPSDEIQALLGGEWIDMTPEKFDSLVYSLNKKVKKSTNLLSW